MSSNQHLSPWSNDKLDARMKALWLAGPSASEIAKTLFDEFGVPMSRSAVIGRAWRTGLSTRTPGLAQALRSKKTKAAPKPKRDPKPTLKSEKRLPENQARTLRDEPVPPTAKLFRLRTWTECAWPVGENEDMHVCGAVSRKGSSYCPHHHGIAWRPAPETKPSSETRPRRLMRSGVW